MCVKNFTTMCQIFSTIITCPKSKKTYLGANNYSPLQDIKFLGGLTDKLSFVTRGIHYKKTSDVCETSDVWKTYKFA